MKVRTHDGIVYDHPTAKGVRYEQGSLVLEGDINGPLVAVYPPGGWACAFEDDPKATVDAGAVAKQAFNDAIQSGKDAEAKAAKSRTVWRTGSR